jgi:hypothetical protein
MAGALADDRRSERLPTILATSPVLMLGGRTSFQAGNDGAPLEVAADSARLTIGGEDVATDDARSFAGRRARILWSPEPTTARSVRRRAS